MWSDEKFLKELEKTKAVEAYNILSFSDEEGTCEDKEELEFIVARSALYSYMYARGTLQARFEKGEEVISTEALPSYLYARDVLKGRFEKGENAIKDSCYYSYLYAKDVLKGRFEKGESTIAETPDYSYLYARDVIKDRFEKGENAIAKDSFFSLEYAKNIMKGKFKKVELSLSRDTVRAVEYAEFTQQRFPAGEMAICMEYDSRRKYEILFNVELKETEAYRESAFYGEEYKGVKNRSETEKSYRYYLSNIITCVCRKRYYENSNKLEV